MQLPTFLSARQQLILSSRVKPIEELPSLSSGDKEEPATTAASAAAKMEDILSLNYSSDKNKAAKKKSTSAKKDDKMASDKNSSGSATAAAAKDICEYLQPCGSSGSATILYADLLRDEIAQVDRKLIVDSKKAGQIGGE